MTHEYEGSHHGDDEGLRERAQQGLGEIRERARAGLHRAQEVGHRARERVSEAGSQLGGRSRDMARQARRSGARAANQLGESYEHSKARFEGGLERHPLAMGLGFFAAGLLVGLTIPRTRKEHEWLGETAEELLDRGREAAHHGIEAGRRTVDATREELRAQGLAPGQLRDKAKRVLNEGIGAARDAAEDEGFTSEELARRADALRETAQTTARREFERLQRQY